MVAVAFPAPVGKCFEGLRTEEVVSCCCCCLRWVGAEEEGGVSHSHLFSVTHRPGVLTSIFPSKMVFPSKPLMLLFRRQVVSDSL